MTRQGFRLSPKISLQSWALALASIQVFAFLRVGTMAVAFRPGMPS
ncbi:hypothetical protein [Acidovorax facilis]